MAEFSELTVTDFLLWALLVVLLVALVVFVPLWIGDRMAERHYRRPAATPPAPETPAATPPASRPRGLVPLAHHRREDRPMTDATRALPEEPEAPSLYSRLTRGGNDTTTFGTVARMLYDRIFGPRGSDPVLEGDRGLLPYFRNERGELVDREEIERHMTAFLMFALGGPKHYTGRAMEVAHRPGRPGHAPTIPIDHAAFDRVIGHLASVLTELEVPPAWIVEVAETAETLRSSVVQTPPAGGLTGAVDIITS